MEALVHSVPPLASRVRHCDDGRIGFVVGDAERVNGLYALAPVVVENTTRRELWPVHLIRPLPRRQQHPLNGGRYKPPAGYPLKA